MKNFTNCRVGVSHFFYLIKFIISCSLATGMTTVTFSQADYSVLEQTSAPISSAGRMLTVVFNQHPVNTKICTGGTGSFSVAATGSASLSYQWQESIDAGSTWSDITGGGVFSGVTTAVLTITAPPSSMDTYRYRCVVSDGTSNISNPAMLTVGPNISLVDQTVTNCPATASNLTTPPAIGVSYQWQVSADNAVSWTNTINGTDATGVVYSGVTTGNLQISNLSTSIDGYMYRYLADDGAGCSVISGIITQRVPALAAFTQPGIIPAGIGDTSIISVNVSSGSGPFTYRWTVSTNGGITYSNLSNNATYSGTTTNSLTIKSITSPMYNYRYRLIVRNSNLCASANSNYSQLILNVALPVKLLSFTAKKINSSTAMLQWEADDIDAPGTFVVQKSGDGNDFVQIGQVAPVAGKKSYTFPDNKLDTGVNSYRLKITDQQGKIIYSKIVTVINREPAIGLLLKPSVTSSGFITLCLQLQQKANLSFTLTDISGRRRWSKLASFDKGEHNVPLNLESFEKGVYYVRVSEGNRCIKVLPMIKE